MLAPVVALGLAGSAGLTAALSVPVPPLPGPGTPLWEAVNAAPKAEGEAFDPAKLVAAVNELVKFGSHRAIEFLRAFRAHERTAGRGGEQIFLVLRAAYDLRPGVAAFPPMLIGGPDWEPSAASVPLLPRFPLVLEADLPLMPVMGWFLGGEAEDPSAHLDWFEKNGTLRTAPLRPPDDPAAAVDAFIARVPELAAAKGAFRRAMLRAQVARAAASALPAADTTKAALEKLYPSKAGPRESAWAPLKAKLAKAKWDAAAGKYTAGP
jgi:hypothetical protein